MIFQISCYIIYSIFEVFSDIYKTCIRCCYKRVRNAVLGCKLKNVRVISVHFQDKPFSITVIQVCVSTTNAKEAEVEPFYEDLLELTPKKDVLFIIGDWNANAGSQEITWNNRQIWPWSTKGSRAKANSVLSRECTGHSKDPLPNNTRDDSTHGHHQMVNTKIRLIIFFAAKDGETRYSQQKQDRELTVAQSMNFSLPNSDFN